MTTDLLRRAEPIVDDVTRRELIIGGAAAVLLVGACGGNGDDARTASPSTADAAPEGWSFTDDLGVTVNLDGQPRRVVAQVSAAATLFDYGIAPVGVFGPTRREDDSAENAAGRLGELDRLESVGSAFGELNVEKLASLRPDLIVTLTYEPGLADARFDPYWYVPGEVQDQVEAIAPIVAIGVVGDPVDHTVSRFAALASALGADLRSESNAGARNRFEAGTADLRAAIAAKPGLTALFVSGYNENLFVANPDVAVDVAWFRELGLDVPDLEVAEGEFWETLSWEQAGRHPADVVFNDIRGQALTVEQMSAEQPTFANLPAVAAGQVGRWHFESPYSYRAMAAVLADLAATIRAADPAIA